MKTHRIAAATVAAAATGIALLSTAGPAAAEVITKNVKVASCANPAGNPQICLNQVGQKFHVNYPGSGSVNIKFTADPSHCSDIYATIYIDGYPEQTKRLQPGSSMKIDTFLPKGLHKTTVQAKGVYGGCNTGHLDSWSGRLTIKKEG